MGTNPTRAYYHQYSRHLTNALTPDRIDFYREHPEYISRRFPALKPEWFCELSSGIVRGTVVLKWLEDYLLANMKHVGVGYQEAWDKLWHIVMVSISIQSKALTSSMSQSNVDSKLIPLHHVLGNAEFKEAVRRKAHIIQFHNHLSSQAETGRRVFNHPQYPELLFDGDFVVLTSFPRSPVIITYQMLVSVLDKIEARASWLYYVLYIDNHPVYSKFKAKDLFHEIYLLLEHAYSVEGNEAIRLFKMMEPLMVSSSLRILPAESNDHNFRGQLLQALTLKAPGLRAYADKLVEIADRYLAVHGESGIPYLIEQMGQEKIHGYPIVSIEGGLKTMYEHGTSLRPITHEAASKIASSFKREYFVAYYEYHKVLPKTFEEFNVDPRIKKLIDAGKPGSIRECAKIPSAAWENLEFKKNHEFNYFPHISDLLDDKAISPHLDHIYQLFSQDALAVMQLVPPFSKENTRLILELLHRPIIDIREFYSAVERLGHIPPNWAIIQLMAKEKELKIDARVFSILTFECRMMASTCERNLGEQILPLFKQQSMTLSGSQLKHKMDVLATLPESDVHVWVKFHMDLEQWNYTFRSFQQSPLLITLDELFGVNHYKFMPQIFNNSLLISANKYTPPGYPGKFTCWRNHAGGNQGILQKLWTIITIIVIRDVMHEADLDHRLTGSGDNQVLFVKLEKGPELRDKIDRIKVSLYNAFQAVGLQLKLEETWVSDSLVCYQRRYHFRGCPVPSGIKHSTRAFAGESDINCGINSIVTTAMNGGASLNEQCNDPLIGIAFAYMEVFTHLLFDVHYSKVIPKDKNQMVVWTWLSSDFGFLPFLQLWNFLYAGHQDTLSESLALLRFIWDNFFEFRQYIAQAVLFTLGKDDSEARLQLILEPTSINISRPRLPEALIREKVEQFLIDPAHVANQQLHTMFKNCQRRDQIQLGEELMKIRPINTAVMHSLFQYSIIGSLLGSISRFNRVSSIVKMVGMNKSGNTEDCFAKTVRELDLRNLRYFTHRTNRKQPVSHDFIHQAVHLNPSQYLDYCHHNQLKPECIFSLRIYLIAYSYRLGLEFITGPYTPPPLEQLIFHDRPGRDPGGSTLLVNPSYNIPKDYAGLELQRGPYTLYIGSRTADPVKSIKLTSLEGVEAGVAIRTMLKLLAWFKSTGSQPNLLRFVEGQLSIRMQGLTHLISGLVPGTAGGNLDHRFGSPGTIMWAFSNSTSLISTWYQITSNRATILQRGEEDRFVFFQQLYHHIYGVLRFCHPYTHQIQVDVRLDHCSYIIPTTSFNAPPLCISGQDKLVGGLVLDPSRQSALESEAAHYTNVMAQSILYNVNKTSILATIIAQDLADQLTAYFRGHTDLAHETHRLQDTQAKINLSVLRKVPLPLLLKQIGIQLAFTGYLGGKMTPHKLVQKLQTRSIHALGVSSLTPLNDLFQALATSGRISELLAYAGMSWNWKGTSSLLSLATPLFQGIAKAIQDWLNNSEPMYLIVEAKSENYQYRRLLSNLRHWSDQLKKIIDANYGQPPITVISTINRLVKKFQIIMVTDLGIALEYARSDRGGHISPVIESYNIGYRDPTPISYVKLGSPPWLLVPVGSKETSKDTGASYAKVQEWMEWESIETKLISQLMRWKRGPSSGAHKLLEMLSNLDWVFDRESLFMTLAEGAGSWAGILLHLYPESTLLYNSLIAPDSTSPAMAGVYIPPGLLCPCGVNRRCLNLPFQASHFGDLAKDSTWQEMLQWKSRNGNSVALLTLDINYDEASFFSVIQHLLLYIKTRRIPCVLVKLMVPALVHEQSHLIDALINMYQAHTWIKPCMSNLKSGEIYLALKDLSTEESTVKDSTIPTIMAAWANLRHSVTSSVISSICIEGVRVTGLMNLCPSWLSDRDTARCSTIGGIMGLMLDPYGCYFDIAYRTETCLISMDRGEQTVIRSLSEQSKSSTKTMWVLSASIIIYYRLRSTIPIATTQDSILSALRQDVSPLLNALKEYSPAACELGVEVLLIQYVALLLYFPDHCHISYVQHLICGWAFLITKIRMYLPDHPTIKVSLQDIIDSTEHVERPMGSNWIRCLEHPLRFFILNNALLAMLKRYGWQGASLYSPSDHLQSWLDVMPWSPSLLMTQVHTIELLDDPALITKTYSIKGWIIRVAVEVGKRSKWKASPTMGIHYHRDRGIGIQLAYPL
nr:MAG: RNA-dependent RNA polymerase [Bat faecal associated arto-like virus 4]